MVLNSGKMKRLISWFVRPYEDTDYITQQTARSLVVVSFIGILLGLVYFLINIQMGTWKQDFINFFFNPLAYIFIMALTLVFVRLGRLKFAGNFMFVLMNLVIVDGVLSNILRGSSFSYSFAGNYYYFLMLLILGSLYASQFTILLMSIVIVLVAVITLLIAPAHYSPAEVELMQTATTDFVANVIAVFVFVIFIKKTFSIALESLAKERDRSEAQYRKLGNILDNIKSVLVKLHEISDKLLGLSQQLSDKAREQAASAEQVAASSEEVTTTIESAANMSDTAHRLSDEALREIEEGQQVLENTILTFTKISEKIDVINDLSNKTDLLAINAAIEAAHAGEAGKGFAVVAQEIRKLSDLAKKASVQISQLSLESHKQTDETKTKFNELVNNIKQTVEHMEMIAAASREQLQAVTQISESITSISQFAAENSQIAQLMYETVQDLAEISHALRNLAAEEENRQ